MTEKEVIIKLKELQMVQLDSNELQIIKEKIALRRSSKKLFGIFDFLTFSPVFSFVTVAVFIIFAGVLFLNSNTRAIEYGQLALAPNQYQRAKIAIAYTNNDFASSTKRLQRANDVSYLAQSLMLTNTQMSALKLKGEKGKYTSIECLELYRKYQISLESMKKTFRNQPVLLTEIKHYDEQAESKLHMYRK